MSQKIKIVFQIDVHEGDEFFPGFREVSSVVTVADPSDLQIPAQDVIASAKALAGLADVTPEEGVYGLTLRARVGEVVIGHGQKISGTMLFDARWGADAAERFVNKTLQPFKDELYKHPAPNP